MELIKVNNLFINESSISKVFKNSTDNKYFIELFAKDIVEISEDLYNALTGDILQYHKVTFDVNGGTFTGIFEHQDIQIVPHNGRCYSLTAPTKPGLSFAGWYKDGVMFNFGATKITEDIALIAEWEE